MANSEKSLGVAVQKGFLWSVAEDIFHRLPKDVPQAEISWITKKKVSIVWPGLVVYIVIQEADLFLIVGEAKIFLGWILTVSFAKTFQEGKKTGTPIKETTKRIYFFTDDLGKALESIVSKIPFRSSRPRAIRQP